jgi:hypothetical protein
MTEAIDIEIESPPGIYHGDSTLKAYQELVDACHAPLGRQIASHLEKSTTTAPSNLIQDEERSKCELSLLTLAFLACHHAIHEDEHTIPLLTTLGSAMAAIALPSQIYPTKYGTWCTSFIHPHGAHDFTCLAVCGSSVS